MYATPDKVFSRRLILSFGFILVLVGLVAGVGIYHLRVLRAELERIIQNDNLRLGLVHEMRTTVRERMLRVNMIFLDPDPFNQDEYYQRMLGLGDRFIRIRAQLEALARDEEERRALAESRAGNVNTATIVESALQLLQEGQVAEGRRVLLQQAFPAQQEVMDRTERVLRLYEAHGQQAVAQARQLYDQAFYALIGLGLAAIVLTGVTSVVVVRRSTRDRRSLLAEIDTRRRTEEQLRQLGARLEHLVEERTAELQRITDRLKEAQKIGRIGHWEWDIASGALQWSDEVYRLFGVEPGGRAPTYEGFLAAVHPEDRSRVMEAVQAALDTRAPYRVDHRVLLPDGSVRHMHEEGIVALAEDGRPRRLLGTVQDVTDAQLLRQQLWDMAHFDSLTGLPNRLLLMDRLQQAIVLAKRQGGRFALALFDLDRFKAVNDRFGHEAGDAFLREVAARLRRAVRASDTIGRYAGDEFIGIFPDIGAPAEAQALMAKIHEQLGAPLTLHQVSWDVSASTGVAFYPRDAQDAEGLLRAADTAMYAVKQGGRDGVGYSGEEGLS